MTRFVMIAAVLMAVFTALTLAPDAVCAAGSSSSQIGSISGSAASSSSSPSPAVVSRGPWPRPPFPTKLGREPDPVPPGELTIRVPIVMWLGMMF